MHGSSHLLGIMLKACNLARVEIVREHGVAKYVEKRMMVATAVVPPHAIKKNNHPVEGHPIR